MLFVWREREKEKESGKLYFIDVMNSNDKYMEDNILCDE